MQVLPLFKKKRTIQVSEELKKNQCFYQIPLFVARKSEGSLKIKNGVVLNNFNNI